LLALQGYLVLDNNVADNEIVGNSVGRDMGVKNGVLSTVIDGNSFDYSIRVASDVEDTVISNNQGKFKLAVKNLVHDSRITDNEVRACVVPTMQHRRCSVRVSTRKAAPLPPRPRPPVLRAPRGASH
jgi:hypothetical protein